MTRPRLILSVTFAVVAALLLLATRWADSRARAATDAAAAVLAASHGSLLTSELQKFRLLPLALTGYADVAAALGPDPAARARLNRVLEQLAARTDAAAIYTLDAHGRAVAASNWRLPTSFVGQDYGFRPYFARAVASGAAELFALGTVSGRPGLYLARRIAVGRRAVGVVVVKVEFDRVEQSWARSPGASVVVDPHGVVLVTSVPGWRFRTTAPLDRATLADVRRTLQFGAAPPGPAPFALAGSDARIGAARYRVVRAPTPLAGGTLLHLSPLAPARAAARTQAALWGLVLLTIAGAGAALAFRTTETRRIQHAARAALEAAVVARTAELSDAHARLVREADERAAIERRFRTAREELAQANRLGTLGQIVAGVAHEINQPVAAIRTYAESGTALLDRAEPAVTRDNLLRIVGLADRIGAITHELRAFARRRTPVVGTAALGDVVDGFGLLLGDRMRSVLSVAVPPALRGVTVVGDRIRLEQILVNLVQNARDAVAGRPDAGVRLAAQLADGRVHVTVADDGSGIAPDMRDTLFAPFVSSRPEGLGLGLAIARDIARGFGGELALVSTGASGTTFVLTLVRA